MDAFNVLQESFSSQADVPYATPSAIPLCNAFVLKSEVWTLGEKIA